MFMAKMTEERAHVRRTSDAGCRPETKCGAWTRIMPSSEYPPMPMRRSSRDIKIAYAVAALFMFVRLSGVLSAPGRGKEEVPKNAKVTLSCDREAYWLGENVLVHLKLENTGGAPFRAEFGHDYRGAPRALRFKVTATDQDGKEAADPYPNSMLDAKYERLQVLVARLDEPDMLIKCMDGLKTMLANTGGGGSNSNIDLAAEGRRVKPQWEAFIKRHAEHLRAGKTFDLPHPEILPEMLPEGYHVSLMDGKNWPKQKWDR